MDINEQNKGIRIIATGGTFDKKYDAIRGVLDFKETHLPEILERVRPNVHVEIENRVLIDSLEMTDEVRLQILDSCKNSPQDQIIVTHGTDTMQQTAMMLGEAVTDKTIVLTGAMVPYTISGSDALFNLGTAFTSVQLLAHGVYIVMNASVFKWDNVKKNKAEGRFEAIR